MKTTYITTLTARFNPFASTAKVPRLLLSLLPPNAHKSIKITTIQLPRASTLPAQVELGFKDGKAMKFSWGDEVPRPAKDGNKPKIERVKLQDIVAEVERHARVLGRKEELSG